jgi:pimeloyl-ACP methyl ester carboxylesterase
MELDRRPHLADGGRFDQGRKEDQGPFGPVVLVPDCGHFVPEERPDWLADRLSTFLD